MRKLTLEAPRDGWVDRAVTVATTISNLREREKQYSREAMLVEAMNILFV
jgi:hypothetical protein